jgi:hypothetical protein
LNLNGLIWFHYGLTKISGELLNLCSKSKTAWCRRQEVGSHWGLLMSLRLTKKRRVAITHYSMHHGPLTDSTHQNWLRRQLFLTRHNILKFLFSGNQCMKKEYNNKDILATNDLNYWNLYFVMVSVTIPDLFSDTKGRLFIMKN